MKAVYVMKWEESERGWGIRPDGYSYHKGVKDYNEYLEKYWNSLPKEVPDEYSRPSWNEVKLQEVDANIYKRVQKEISVRVY